MGCFTLFLQKKRLTAGGGGWSISLFDTYLTIMLIKRLVCVAKSSIMAATFVFFFYF